MNTRRTHLDWLAISLLLLCCLFWGWQQVLVKATLPEVPAVSQAALRFIGSALTLWVLSLIPILRCRRTERG